jgi:hypothetical protein
MAGLLISPASAWRNHFWPRPPPLPVEKLFDTSLVVRAVHKIKLGIRVNLHRQCAASHSSPHEQSPVGRRSQVVIRNPSALPGVGHPTPVTRH